MKLISLSFAWVLGIYLGSIVSIQSYALFFAFIIPSLLFVIYRNKKACLWIGLCSLALMGGALLFQHSQTEPSIQGYNDWGWMSIRGIVDKDPRYNESSASIRLSAQQIKTDGKWIDVSGGILIHASSFVPYACGDHLQVSGMLETPTAFDDFDYPSYLAEQGIYSTINQPQIEFLDRGWSYSLRNRLSNSLASALPEPQGSLSQALLLGIRSHIPQSVMEAFRTTGTAHIVAISGLHVAILGGIALGAASWLFGRQRPTYIIITLTTIWLYTLLAGMNSPVFRAAIMFSLFLVALWIGRPRSALPALALAAAVILALDPEALWTVSFQLSFVAVVGLIFLVPPIQRLGERASTSIVGEDGPLTSISSALVSGLAVSLGAVIATLPLVAYYFGYVSLVGIPATLLVLPLLPCAIVAAGATAVVGMFAPNVAQVIGWTAWLCLSYIIEVVECFASLPFATTHVDGLNSAWVWSYYMVFGAAIWIVPSQKLVRKRLSGAMSSLRTAPSKLVHNSAQLPNKWALLPLVLLAALIWIAVLIAPDDNLEVSFLDVGQGDAIYIQTPTGQQILIDGGPNPEKLCLELGEQLPFWDKSLDLVVLTHPESDHLGGLLEVLRRYEIGQVLIPNLDNQSSVYEEWVRLLDEKEIECTIALEGQHIDLGTGITLEVLHPQEELIGDDTADLNENSVVLWLMWNEVSFLLTGDIEYTAEHELLYQGLVPKSTVLKLAHHGSNSSTTAPFFAAVDPEIAVISVGEQNSFGHPAEEVLERLSETVEEDNIYLTSEHGTITFTTDGESLWVECEKS